VLALDRNVPALVVRTGHPVWDYGALATMRSLGRLRVPVYVMCAPHESELRASVYLTANLGPPVDPAADTSEQIAHLNKMVAAIGQPTVAIAGDDESAVLLAEQRRALDERLLTSQMEPGLPRRLSDKVALGALAHAAGVPYPRFIDSDDPALLEEFVRHVGLPLIAKRPAPFSRLAAGGALNRMVSTWQQVRTLQDAAAAGDMVFMQEFLSGPATQTWYAAGIASTDGRAPVVWTGRKLMSHPTGTGVGVLNLAQPHAELATHVAQLCEHIGYAGPFDTDWIVNPGRGTAHLIDFNPRRGAQFRTFQTSTGLDAVRATHLGLTGRPLPSAQQRWGLVHTVENLAVLHGSAASPWRHRSAGEPVEFSWWASDDPRPAASIARQMAVRAAGKVAARISGPRVTS
jgi:predicted ATP-grasp superfamily ATP-dependent carboligase